MLITIIPAHNEERAIGQTLASLKEQTVVPDLIFVVLDNCTDNTDKVASKHGAYTFVTHDNKNKKAGALNQILDFLLPFMNDESKILVMDADTALSKNFIEDALPKFEDTTVGGVGGSFFCKEEKTIVQKMQGNEYQRYVREIARKKGKANVLTGAGSIFRVRAFKEIREAREEGRLPGKGYYDESALTEDNEMTLALKHLGYKCLAPRACEIYTDAPENYRALYHQRIRWRRGAFENLKDYGWTKVTFPYMVKTCWTGFVTVVTMMYVVAVLVSLVVGMSSFAFNPLWLGIFGLYIFERYWTVRNRKSGALVATAIVPEMIYDNFQQFIFFIAFWKFIGKRDEVWIHG